MTGSFVALITPFNKDGSVDFAAFRTLLNFQEDHGTAAVLIMGSTGETSMLAPEEKKRIIVETAKMKTAQDADLLRLHRQQHRRDHRQCQFAKDNGADGAILAAPAYICAPEADIERFFLDVADATDLPLGIYNNPPRVKSDLHWDHLLRIFKHPNYVVHKEFDRAGRPGRAGSRRQARRRGDVLRQPQSRPCRADHEPRRSRHRQHDRQYRAGRTRHHLDAVGAAMPKPRASRTPICGCCRCCTYTYSAINPVAVKSLMKALGMPAGDLRKPLTSLEAEALAKGVRIVAGTRARQDIRLQYQAAVAVAA